MLSLIQTEQDARALPPEARVQFIAERILALTGASGSAIALRDDAGIFVCRARAGESAPRVGAPLNIEAGISGACVRTREVIRCEDVWKDERVDPSVARKINVRSVLAAPLLHQGETIGLVQALSARPYAFSVSDLERLKKLGELLAEHGPEHTVDAVVPEAEALEELATPVEFADAREQSIEAPIWIATHEIVEPSVAEREEYTPESSTPAASNVIEFPAPVESAHDGIAETAEVEPAPAEIAAGAVPEEHSPPVIVPEDAPVVPGPVLREPTPMWEPAPRRSEAAHESAQQDNSSSPLLFQAYSEPVRSHRNLWWTLAAALLLAAAVYWYTQHGTALSHLLESFAPGKAAPAATTTQQATTSDPSSATPSAATPPAMAQSGSTSPASEGNLQPEALPATAPSPSPALADSTDSGPSSLTGIRVTKEAGRTVVLLALNNQTHYEEHRLSNPDRIYFDLQGTALSHSVPARLSGDGSHLVRVRAASSQPGVTRVVLDTNGTVDYRVRMTTEPYGLRIEMGTPAREVPKAVASAPKPGAHSDVASAPLPSNGVSVARIPAKPLTMPTPSQRPQERIANAKLKIVLDPGHGGWDMGTIGNRGLMEKDLALDVAHRLSLLLKKNPDYDVVLTRDDDSYVALEQRASAANAAGADLFISIHGNYSSRSHARGVETFYPSAAGADAAVTARSENSRKLAGFLQAFLHHEEESSNPGLPDRGVKPANYAVLRSTAMPAALAEVSFVSSPNDEKQLIQSSYRQQLAEALYKGISSYVSQRNQKLTASTGARSSGQ